jgi:hypothetical protein
MIAASPSLIEILDKISKGPTDSDGGKLIGVSDKNEALDMCHVEREQYGGEIIQGEHRALVDDNGAFLSIEVCPGDQWALADAVVTAELVKELRNGHSRRARLLAETYPRLAGGSKKENAVLGEAVGLQ